MPRVLRGRGVGGGVLHGTRIPSSQWGCRREQRCWFTIDRLIGLVLTVSPWLTKLSKTRSAIRRSSNWSACRTMKSRAQQRGPREARRQQSGGFREGSSGTVDDQQGRGARAHQAGRYADRGDERQYGYRTCDGSGDPRLQDGADHAGGPVGRAPPEHGCLRCRNHPDAGEGRDGAGTRSRGPDAARRQRRDPRPVREPRQSDCALRSDRPGNLARYRRAHHALRVGMGTTARSWARRTI